MTWKEDEHPRGGEGTKEGGRFVPKGSSGTPAAGESSNESGKPAKKPSGERIRALMSKLGAKIDSAELADDWVRHKKLTALRDRLKNYQPRQEKEHPAGKQKTMTVYRGSGRVGAPTSADVLPMRWFSTDRKYSSEYGPNVSQQTLVLDNPIDLRSITTFREGYERRRTVEEWVGLLGRHGLSVHILDADYSDVDVPLWDLLRGAETLGVEKATDFGKVLSASGYDAVIWNERRTDGSAATAIGVLTERQEKKTDAATAK